MKLIKTYPLKLELEFHKKIKRMAFEKDVTMEHFIIEAIKEKLVRG